MSYLCAKCGAFGVRLFRNGRLFQEQQELQCMDCVTETVKPETSDYDSIRYIGNMEAAIPYEDGTWEQKEAPHSELAWQWWLGLPVKPHPSHPKTTTILELMKRATSTPWKIRAELGPDRKPTGVEYLTPFLHVDTHHVRGNWDLRLARHAVNLFMRMLNMLDDLKYALDYYDEHEGCDVTKVAYERLLKEARNPKYPSILDSCPETKPESFTPVDAKLFAIVTRMAAGWAKDCPARIPEISYLVNEMQVQTYEPEEDALARSRDQTIQLVKENEELRIKLGQVESVLQMYKDAADTRPERKPNTNEK